MYQAEQAQLDFEIQQRRNELQRLAGYNQGTTHIPGELETDMGMQLADIEHMRRLAIEAITNAARNNNTLFSGRRPVNQARAEYPYISQAAQLQTTTARSLAQVYQQIADLAREREVRNSLLLAEAASRRAQMFRGN